MTKGVVYLRIGIPRALLYFWYGSAWETFLRYCGFEVVTSPPTNKQQIELGVRSAQDEICLPVKVFLGHVRYLVDIERVDAVLVPHLIQVELGCYICPKFMGLPDMVRMVLPSNFLLYIWRSDRKTPLWSINAIPPEIRSRTATRIAMEALQAAQAKHRECWRELAVEKPAANSATIGLIAHPYCLYDDGLNLGLLKRLNNAGVQVIRPEMVPDKWFTKSDPGLNKPLFWTLGRRVLGSAMYYANLKVDGVIHLSAFACGPESVVGEVVARRLHEHQISFLHINLDEHTGEAGFATRVEAFLDLLARRKTVCG
jgi:predicted nucleotide-binding protein (sugar kinase/HSP70/actin superfamily)